MSSPNPIFDAALADAPVNIWQASNIFPRPVSIRVQTFAPDFREYRDWSEINPWALNLPTRIDPANLSFLRNVA